MSDRICRADDCETPLSGRQRDWCSTTRESKRSWRRRNPENARYWRSRTKWANAWTNRASVGKQRARQARVVVLDFTPSELRARLEYFGYACWMCGGVANSLDHVKPLAARGPHMLSNLRPACITCNDAKRAQWPYRSAAA